VVDDTRKRNQHCWRKKGVKKEARDYSGESNKEPRERAFKREREQRD